MSKPTESENMFELYLDTQKLAWHRVTGQMAASTHLSD
jgi:hypothetical protein